MPETRPAPAVSMEPKTRHPNMLKNIGPLPERRSTISSMMPFSYQNHCLRLRNLSGGSSGSTTSGSGSSNSSLTQLDNQYSEKLPFPLEISLYSNNSSAVPSIRESSAGAQHRKLDRSWSDTTDGDRNGSQKLVNASRYKTELCRPFEESGSCKYGDKCQFAHGYHELRNLVRHPKYKTELCRTFHTVGFCPYGPRCHFIHEDEVKPTSPRLGRAGSLTSSSGSSSPSLSPSGSDIFSYQPEVTHLMSTTNSHVNGLTGNMNYGSNNIDLQSLEKHFSSLKLSSSNSDYSSILNNNQKPKPIGSEERDIFSEVTMFNSEEVLDNTSTSSCAAQSMRLDNFPFVDTRKPAFWQSSYRDY
ncbi:unnamed protein product [Candidula unifasciata]|uniref:C3H1-type domain-containing protein n=1 Tax=Candidula unifasciata TaxID=100452 RepID=A0A8S3ZPP0_9EUPU|nr:unnamed protein product [Candidula unifasciata]